MIKLVIFDLSGVCFTNEEPPYLADFAKKYNLPFEEFDNFYQTLLKKAEIGLGTGREVWEKILEKYKINKDVDEIIKEMISMKEAKEETLNFAKSLKNKLQVVYLTNYCKIYWDSIDRKFNLQEYFTRGFVSYQLKARKPSKEAFEKVLSLLNKKPEEAVFIDDSESNLKEARKLGMKTIVFREVNQLKEDLKNLIS